jgi:hypothetical protein
MEMYVAWVMIPTEDCSDSSYPKTTKYATTPPWPDAFDN